ncbi:transglycosylase domain-containing protein [Anaerovorax odorimutans]|uniref:Penicillin-binding protein 1A n=1 Tax=Anaerovorax odorimutans TaxID=109327 RepID=A0ABT1RTH5_9FIRM|nr:transglycosylase domain-containing protein [Anaerovorax odorimutans]MCQ4638510.1 transglycosylase domain-containing protein [Anaerovorax odorimutans]
MGKQFDKHSNTDNIDEFFAEFDKFDDTCTKKNKDKDTRTYANVRAKGRNVRTKSKKATNNKVLKIIGIVIVGVALLGVIYVGILIFTADTHNINANNIYSCVSQRSTIYDDEGREIENVFTNGGNRTNISYDELPKDLVNAVVAIEDKTFWKHHGFNFIRIMGAIKESLLGSKQISGTSTLTQQLARNIYLADRKSQRSLNRKILEAYYTVLIEKNLTKEQILEAYLNTVYLGFNCYGVETASQAYFGKSVKDLKLLECISLASLPQAPDSYALVKVYPAGQAEVTKKKVLAKSENAIYVYNGDKSKDRRELTAKNMLDQGYINQSNLEEVKQDQLKNAMKISSSEGVAFTSYFTDYVVDEIIKDIMEEYGWNEVEARKMIYTGGLKIYTTMNKTAQKIVKKEFDDNINYPTVANLKKDTNGNLIDNKTKKIQLYKYDNYFNKKKQYIIKKSEYRKNGDGSLTLYSGKRLAFYSTVINGKKDISLEFKTMYRQWNGKFYIIKGGTLSIPQGYKYKDANGNCILSAEFLKKYPKFFVPQNGDLIVSADNYTLQQEVVQPQSAMVIMDYNTGGIKAMIGGRDINGRLLQNRAISPRQPGSSIKPIAIYSSALQESYNKVENGMSMSLSNSDGSNWGKYITAGSVINDAPMVVNGQIWPKNWYSGYRGHMTLRTAVEQSVNVCAVKVYQQIGPEFIISQLKKMGITTLVESGKSNDINPAALALGGMTKGISPMEMAAAYGIFPNQGVYTAPIAYTKITNSNGEVLFDKTPNTEKVIDAGVAYIMTSILRSVVTNGLGRTASFEGQPVAGKTGTTTNNYDAWFVGFTPQYTAALWIGNDINIELSEGSAASARLWRNIMNQVCASIPYGKYPDQPNNIDKIRGEYYIKGTYSSVGKPITSENGSKPDMDIKEKKRKETKRSTTNPSTNASTIMQSTKPSVETQFTETPSTETKPLETPLE